MELTRPRVGYFDPPAKNAGGMNYFRDLTCFTMPAASMP